MNVLIDTEGGELTDLGLLFILLAPALVPALVAGVGSVCVMRPRLLEDRRVLERSGAAPRQWLSVSVWETTVTTGTVGLLTVAMALPGVILTNAVVLGDAFPPPPPGWPGGILWLPLAAILVLMWVLVFGIRWICAGPRLTSRKSAPPRPHARKPATDHTELATPLR